MEDTDLLPKLAKRIDQIPSLHEAFGADPQVVWMPLTSDPKKRNLFVGLFIAEDYLTKETLASVCSRTISELNAAKAFVKGEGLEIMLCVARGETAEPVLKVQVANRALANAELLTVDDLGKRVPSEGITCMLYRRALQ
jgi:hypothetical protein